MVRDVGSSRQHPVNRCLYARPRTRICLLQLLHVGRFKSIFEGVFYGYPPDAIVAYIQRQKGLAQGIDEMSLPNAKGTVFDGVGLIPSSRQRNMATEEVVREINLYRFDKKSFSLEDFSQHDRQLPTEKLHSALEQPYYLRRVNLVVDRIVAQHSDLVGFLRGDHTERKEKIKSPKWVWQW